jgi:hypothetical protein
MEADGGQCLTEDELVVTKKTHNPMNRNSGVLSTPAALTAWVRAKKCWTPSYCEMGQGKTST